MTTLQKSAQDQLRQYVEQVENLEEQKRAMSEDIRDVFTLAKSNGFDVPAMRKIIKLRKKSKSERDEEESLVEVYKAALGMISDLPLGQWSLGQIKEPSQTVVSA